MEHSHYDALILPGGGILPDGSIPEHAQPRLNKAAELYKNGTVSAIVASGSHSYKADEKPALSEAEAYSKYLQSQGVPQEGIYLETDSQETLGNFVFTKMNILMKHDWKRVLVLPTQGHSTERIDYILRKVLGPDYQWDIVRIGLSDDPDDLLREAESLEFTKKQNDSFKDGNHQAIYNLLLSTHPGYGHLDKRES